MALWELGHVFDAYGLLVAIGDEGQNPVEHDGLEYGWPSDDGSVGPVWEWIPERLQVLFWVMNKPLSELLINFHVDKYKSNTIDDLLI